MMEDIDSMKYIDLQKLAKQYGIKANQKGDKIIAALRELSGQPQLTTDSHKECTTTTDSEPEEKVIGRKARKNRKGAKNRKKTKSSENQTNSLRQSADDLMTDDEDHQKEIEALMTDDEDDDEITFQPKRRSRSNTFTRDAPSPNVKDLLESMRDDMTADQRKKSLMEALDKNLDKNSKETSRAAPNSNIPRFTGLSRKSKESAEQTKTRTPGKDWSKIHKRQWDKMDSLDEYLAKKRKRTETVSQSVKKLKLMTEQMKTNMQNRKQLKSPASTAKGGDKTKTTLFQSPKPVAPFKPKVISTTKMDLNFANASNKEKIVMTSRTEVSKKVTVTDPKPVKGGQALFTIGKMVKGTGIPKRLSKENRQRQTSISRKSQGDAVKSDTTANRSMASPHKQSANRTFTTTPARNTVSANKSLTTASTNKFDIQASLSKRVNYKPHKGQLKPFSFGKLHNSETSFKEVKVKSRDDRRQENAQRRTEKKSNLQMAKRGISVS